MEGDYEYKSIIKWDLRLWVGFSFQWRQHFEMASLWQYGWL